MTRKHGPKRNTLHPNTPDLDYISREALEALVKRWTGLSITQLGVEVYPEKPIKHLDAVRVLRAIAIRKLDTGEVDKDLYARLPKLAQWRRKFNPAAAVLSGRKLVDKRSANTRRESK